MFRTLALVCFVTACGSSSPSPSSPRTKADLGPMCHRYFTALIDLRAELDTPPGIRAELAQEGKPALLDKARAEWHVDTAAAKVDQMCSAMATQTPDDRVRPLRTFIASGAHH